MAFAAGSAGGGWRDRLNSKKQEWGGAPAPTAPPTPAPASDPGAGYNSAGSYNGGTAGSYSGGSNEGYNAGGYNNSGSSNSGGSYDWTSQAAPQQAYYGQTNSPAAPTNTGGWYDPNANATTSQWSAPGTLVHTGANRKAIWAIILATVGFFIVVGPIIGAILAILSLREGNQGTLGKVFCFIALASCALLLLAMFNI